MTLITDEDRKALLQNGQAAAQSDSFDPIPVVKIFAPDGRSTWLLSELDPSDPDLAFGLADLGQGAPELGNFLLSEIAEVSGTAGLPPERDRFFRATATLSVYAAAARAAGAIINPQAV